jgi:hypothetical protein
MAQYVASKEFSEIPDYSLSEYWTYFHDQITVSTASNKVNVEGRSGYYAPKRRGVISKIKRVLRNAEDREFARQILVTKLLRQVGAADLLANAPADIAFDMVMQRHDAAEVVLSPYRIDFRAVAAQPGALTRAAQVNAEYKKLSGGIPANGTIYRAYYLVNILNHLGVFTPDFAFTEIGGGNGNLARLLLERAKRTCYMVDLPRTLCGAAEYLSGLRPNIKILFPNEAVDRPHVDADLVFLTPAQLHLIPAASMNLVLNTDSFQEMTRKQVEVYFDLADRIIAPQGHFFVYNRVEKIPTGESSDEVSYSDLMRFSAYPWRPDAEIRAEEICRMARLTQRDDVFMRLERHS